MKKKFLVLSDFIEKGIERIYTAQEVGQETPILLNKTTSLKILGIGNSWLVKGDNLKRLEEMLIRNYLVMILIPDPLASEIQERYTHDEPPTFELGLEGLARRILDWYDLFKKHPNLSVKAYTRYPVVNLSIYDNYVYASPVLFKRRAKDSFTAVFRRPSSGAQIYEEHFDKIYHDGSSIDITDPSYIRKLCNKFKLQEKQNVR
jgi:hypothetical protein